MPSLPTTFAALRALTGFRVSSGATLSALYSAAASVDFANMASVITAPLSGVLAGDAVFHNLGSNWSGDYLNITVISQCTIDGIVSFTASNKSAGVIDPAATTVRYTAFGF
jgi:hypothetical protein